MSTIPVKVSADFKFSCPHCQQSLEAPADMAGEQIDCPACKGSIVLPGVNRIPVQPAKPPPLMKTASRNSRGWEIGKAAGIAGAIVVGLVLMGKTCDSPSNSGSSSGEINAYELIDRTGLSASEMKAAAEELGIPLERLIAILHLTVKNKYGRTRGKDIIEMMYNLKDAQWAAAHGDMGKGRALERLTGLTVREALGLRVDELMVKMAQHASETGQE